MNNFQEFDTSDKIVKTNYKKWAFRFFIYIIFLNIWVANMATRPVFDLSFDPDGNIIESKSNIHYYMLAAGITATLLMLSGFVLTILSISKKEKRDYQYYISIIGYITLLIVAIMRSLKTN